MAGLQPPARSWFRLASIARMEAAEAAAAASTARSTTTPTTPPLPRTPIPRPQQQPTSSPPPPLQQPPTPPTPLPPPPPPLQEPTTPPTPPLPPPPASPAPQAEPQPELPFTPTPQPEIKAQIATEAASTTPPSPYEPQQLQQIPYEPQQPPTPPRVATPPESPKVIKPSSSSPPPSPTLKQTNNTHNPEPEPETKPPRPPLYDQTFSALPEEKTITNSNGSRASNVSYSKEQGPPTKEDKKLRVITMAGDNTGAVMDIGSAAPHRLGHHFHKSDGNGHGRKMEQEHEDSKKGGKGAAKAKHMEAVVNSNVQGINNSIVLNSITTQHSPGVHITFASNRKPKGSGSSSSHKAHHSDQLH